jgi:DNA-binding MarR family transcriptional regulator
MPTKSKITKKSPRQASDMIEVNHDETILRTFILFVQSAQSVLKYADAAFYRKAKLSVIKFIVLQALATNGGTMAPSTLTRWTSTKRHSITTLVDRLMRDELVTAQRNERDRRFVNITLTDKGTEVLKQARPVAREIVNQVMLSVSEGDALLFEKLLKVLRQNAQCGLEQVAGQAPPQPD